MKLTKQLLVCAALLPIVCSASTAYFSYPNGWNESLDNYPTDADVLNFANGRTDSAAANVNASCPPVAGVRDYRFSRQEYSVDAKEPLQNTPSPSQTRT